MTLAPLHELLDTLEGTGRFAAEGMAAPSMLALEVEGLGLLGAPFGPAVAGLLAGVAEVAPYGKGPATLIDPAVRRCMQIDAEKWAMVDGQWPETLATITAAAATALGVQGDVVAEPYKLLLYRAGDFFLPHRDTEKAAGMFGTLVLTLPSHYEGGALVVEHAGERLRLGEGGGSLDRLQWSAFYADCRHELEPLAAGERVALVYNLCRRDGTAVAPPAHGAAVQAVAETLGALAAQPDGAHERLLLLHHHYSAAELSPSALKGRDQAALGVLTAATRAVGWGLGLALLRVCEEGGAYSDSDWDWRGRSRRSWYGASAGGGDHQVSYEICGDVERTEDLERVDVIVGASRLCLAGLKPDPQAWSQPGCTDDLPFDVDVYHESSGNEGGTFERSYRRAVWLLWPLDASAELAARAAPKRVVQSVQGLDDTSSRSLRDAVVRVALRRAQTREDHDWRVPWRAEHVVDLAAAVLPTADDAAGRSLLRACVAAIPEVPGLVDEASAALELAATNADRDALEACIEALHGDASAARAYTLTALLRGARDSLGPEARGHLAEPLAALLRRLGHGAAPFALEATRWGSEHDEAPLATRLAAAVLGLVADLDLDQGAAVAAELAWQPELFPVDLALLPALQSRFAEAVRPCTDVEAVVARACLDDLAARHGPAPTAPTDARRSATSINCRCGSCAAAVVFLGDPVLETWELRAVKDTRGHVEAQLRGCDVACETVRQGSPHRLVVRKTMASYEAELLRWERDEGRLVWLERAVEGDGGSGSGGG